MDKGLLLTPGKAEGLPLPQPGEQGKQLVDLVDGPDALAARVRPYQEVLVHGEAREYPASLRDVGDPKPTRLCGGIWPTACPSNRTFSGSVRMRPQMVRSKRGLAGAVGADDGVGLPLFDAQVHIEQGLEMPVA